MIRFLVTLLLFLVPCSAMAQEALDRSIVTQYLEDMAALYTADRVDYAEANRFLTLHVDPDASIVMRTKKEGEKEREAPRMRTLQELLDFNAQTKLETLNSQARYRLHDINYDAAAGEALVIYTFWHDADIRNTLENGRKAILGQHMKANCQERVRLVAGVLKVFSTDCNVDVSYEKPYLVKE